MPSSPSPDDHYVILGLRQNAARRDVRAAFRRLAKKWHPDKHVPKNRPGAEVRFKRIVEAFEVLVDAERRAEYDEARRRASFVSRSTVPRRSEHFSSVSISFHLGLRHACLWGDAHRLRSLLSSRRNPRAFLRTSVVDRSSGESALHLASRRGHLACVILLIRAGASPTARRREDLRTPLHCACARGLTEIVRVLISASPAIALSMRDRGGRTPADIAHMWGYAASYRACLRV